MTKDRFIAIHTRRGYEVEDLGKMVILHMDNYTAIWFFNADGSPDESQHTIWKVTR